MIRPRSGMGMPLCLLLVLGLSACAPVPADNPADALLGSMLDVPADAPPGTCWGKIVSPALIETVTEQVLVEPARQADDGTVTTPAIFRTETRQRIVTEREVTWFETPCPAAMTPELIATLQRALSARDLYAGPITGQIDTATSTAVRLYQSETGLDSPILSLAAARALGLIATPLDQLDE